MKKTSRLDYAYAVGRVRALENNLIPREVFKEAAEGEDFSSSMKVIYDTGTFLDESAEIINSDELDRFIYREEKELFRLVSNLLLEEKVFKVLISEDRLDKMNSIAEDLKYDFIKDYYRHKIDLGNLKMFIRIKYADLPEEKFKEVQLKGGFLDETFFIRIFDLSFSEIGEKLHATAYQDIWKSGIHTLEANETFVEFERGMESFLMRYLKKAKFIVFGPEPVFAYTLAKKRELALIRLLGIGKLNKIPSDTLKARMSETYV
jgi:V/A-type H+-transporting ATPase subunit C